MADQSDRKRCSCPPGDDAKGLQVVAVRHLVPMSQGEMVPGFVGKQETVSGVQRKFPKDESHPVCAISSDKSNAGPLDLQSWILVVPFVSHVSECPTIRTAFALPRRNDNRAETSTRLAKKGKARSRRWNDGGQGRS